MRNLLESAWNALMLPLRLVAGPRFLNRLGLRSMRDERIRIARANSRGRLLDVGCGEGNLLARSYPGPAVGVDVHPWPGIDILCNTARLPFSGASFQTVTMLATLNHIPNRIEVLRECRRVLSPDGVLLITMLSPSIGWVRHKAAWWDVDQTQRTHAPGELTGMSDRDIRKLLSQSGFRLLSRKHFVCGLNSLYIAEPEPQPS